MSGIFIILLLGLTVIFWPKKTEETERKPSKIASQIDKLWDIAQDSMRDKRYLRAEKALLTILNADQKNAPAYNRLGILYAKQNDYNDAIECFEIAQSLQPSASSLHNVGLIYYEVGKFDKAVQAFEQALAIEANIASRHVAYAKALEALGNKKKVIGGLEKAVKLEKNPQSVGLLADALERDGQNERADKLRLVAKKMAEKGDRKRIKQPNKVRV